MKYLNTLSESMGFFEKYYQMKWEIENFETEHQIFDYRENFSKGETEYWNLAYCSSKYQRHDKYLALRNILIFDGEGLISFEFMSGKQMTASTKNKILMLWSWRNILRKEQNQVSYESNSIKFEFHIDGSQEQSFRMPIK